jgi:hypothetical protein
VRRVMRAMRDGCRGEKQATDSSGEAAHREEGRAGRQRLCGCRPSQCVRCVPHACCWCVRCAAGASLRAWRREAAAKVRREAKKGLGCRSGGGSSKQKRRNTPRKGTHRGRGEQHTRGALTPGNGTRSPADTDRRTTTQGFTAATATSMHACLQLLMRSSELVELLCGVAIAHRLHLSAFVLWIFSLSKLQPRRSGPLPHP